MITADYKSRIRAAQLAVVAGVMTGITSGNVKAGPVFSMADKKPVPGTLAATVSVTANTATITLTAIWEVSDDGVTYMRCMGGVNNPADVVLATGTSAAVTRSIAAPPQVYGYRYCRLSILVGVTTGLVADLYSIRYNFCEQS